MTHDGLGKYLSQEIVKVPGPITNIDSVLKQTGADVFAKCLPVGA